MFKCFKVIFVSENLFCHYSMDMNDLRHQGGLAFKTNALFLIVKTPFLTKSDKFGSPYLGMSPPTELK